MPDAEAAPVDAGTESSPGTEPDSGAEIDAAPKDAALEGSCGPVLPCVDHVDLPRAPAWAVWAYYPLPGSNNMQGIPYYCPDLTKANDCQNALGNPPDDKVYPVFGQCRIPVPAGCRACTGDVTEW